MRNLVLCALVAATLLFTEGCTSSTGVMPMGPDTWTVTAHSEHGPGSAQKKALEDANAFAKARGKHISAIDIQTRETLKWSLRLSRIHIYQLTFRLVDSDDPEYQREKKRALPLQKKSVEGAKGEKSISDLDKARALALQKKSVGESEAKESTEAESGGINESIAPK